jgi:WhiB family transcriptional regulator, redox-sensing transcriptional regulator
VSVTRSDRTTARETRLEWRRRAACRLMPAEMFFPVGTTGLAVEDAIEAKAVCTHCEVRTACLAFAIDSRQEFGIWGGTDEEERRELTRRAQRGGR